MEGIGVYLVILLLFMGSIFYIYNMLKKKAERSVETLRKEFEEELTKDMKGLNEKIKEAKREVRDAEEDYNSKLNAYNCSRNDKKCNPVR